MATEKPNPENTEGSARPEALGAATETALHIFREACAAGASDIHLKTGVAPLVRIDGELRQLEHPPLQKSLIETTIALLVKWAGVEHHRLKQRQVDFSVAVPGVGRFRAHAYRQAGTAALALRSVPTSAPELTTLRLPPVVKQVALETHGLVLVTGPTGHGKSTTIAALLEYMNRNVSRHIVTLEDPVEFVFEDRLSSFAQREVGRDIDNLEQGLRGSVREDPDVVVMGAIETLSEFEIALNTAESGRLVISTLTSVTAQRTIERVLNFYPPELQAGVRLRLADALKAILSQRLVQRRGGRARILATEVFLNTALTHECIRDPNRLRTLASSLANGTREFGTQCFDQVLAGMVSDKMITPDMARAVAGNSPELNRMLKGTEPPRMRGSVEPGRGSVKPSDTPRGRGR